MEQCWDADPSKRPDINELLKEIKYYPIKPKKLKIKMDEETTFTSSKLRTSKIHELRSTTEEQEEFYGKPYDSNNSYNSCDKIEIRDNSKELDDLRIPDGNEINEYLVK
uniref:Serine-threonine/tyrosine-protein kinase catalytic domain-containing protein n=2 Tax=Rhizophagus irregularis TaxID=588596 RepID=U9U1P4_RHIID